MKVAVVAVAAHFVWSMLTFKTERRPDTDMDRDEVSDKIAVAESRLEDPKVRAEMERRYCSSSCLCCLALTLLSPRALAESGTLNSAVSELFFGF